MTERERMNKGLIYNPGDSEIMKEQEGCLEPVSYTHLTLPTIA